MNRFKCPKCKGNQFSANADESTPCIHCGNSKVKQMDTLEEIPGENKIFEYEKNDRQKEIDLAINLIQNICEISNISLVPRETVKGLKYVAIYDHIENKYYAIIKERGV